MTAKEILIEELNEDMHPEKVEDVIFWALEYYVKHRRKGTWGETIAYAIVERIKEAESLGDLSRQDKKISEALDRSIDNLKGMKNDRIYLACYSTGEYDDFETHIVFASNVKSRVTKWVLKFNKMHQRWKAHYDQYCDSRYGDILGRWITEEHYDKYNRWHMLRNINRAYCDEIELR